MNNELSAVWNFNRSAFRLAGCFYAAVGVFGITLISDFLLKYQVIINIFGGVFIGTYIWWGTLTAVTNIIKKKTREFGLLRLIAL